MASTVQTRATLDDLLKFDGNAELIDGRIVRIMPSGDLPGEVALEIVVSLRAFARARGIGFARGDGVGYALDHPLTSGRRSFSPDASYHVGPRPVDPMRFVPGPPSFAVEVRSDGDYGPAAERGMAAKRADYFEAGTLVVWDVDPLAKTVAVYRADAPDRPATFGPGQVADAEPVAPGWTLAVDALFA